MKNILIGLMAAGAITAGAQAQKAPDTQQDVQSKVATTVGATRLGNQDAVSLGVITGQDAVMVHIDGAVSEKDRAFLASIGVALGEGGYTILTIAQYQSWLPEYQQRVSANTVGIKGVVNNPLPGINTASLEVKHGSGTDKHLRDDTKKYSFTVEEVLQTQSPIPGGTRYTTQKTTAQTNITENTSHDYTAGNTTSVTLSATGQVGSHTTLTGSVTHTQTRIPGEVGVGTTSAALSGKYHMPQAQANISAGVATGGVVALGFQKKVSNALVFGATISGTSQKNIGAYTGVTYYFDGDAPNPGQITTTTPRKMRDDMLAINAAGYAVNPMSVGNVKQTVTRKETKISTMVESAQDVLDPVVPPVKPGTPNTAPTAVNFASTGTPTAESLTVGQVVGSISCVDYAPTGAQNNCSYAGGDAQFGIASITGQVVIKNANLSAGTYTFPTRATDANGLSIDGTAKVTILPAAVTPNTAPSAVNFAPGAVLIAERLAVGQTVGQLSCTDLAPTGAQNTCTYTGGNSNFAVSVSGSITLLNTSLAEGTYAISVAATDAGGLSKTVSVSIQVQEPCFGLTGEILQSCILSH